MTSVMAILGGGKGGKKPLSLKETRSGAPNAMNGRVTHKARPNLGVEGPTWQQASFSAVIKATAAAASASCRKPEVIISLNAPLRRPALPT